MLFQKPQPADARDVRGGHDAARRGRVNLTEDVVMGARGGARGREPSRVRRRVVARTGPHQVVVELAARATLR